MIPICPVCKREHLPNCPAKLAQYDKLVAKNERLRRALSLVAHGHPTKSMGWDEFAKELQRGAQQALVGVDA